MRSCRSRLPVPCRRLHLTRTRTAFVQRQSGACDSRVIPGDESRIMAPTLNHTVFRAVVVIGALAPISAFLFRGEDPRIDARAVALMARAESTLTSQSSLVGEAVSEEYMPNGRMNLRTVFRQRL